MNVLVRASSNLTKPKDVKYGDGDCSVCQNAGKPTAFYVAYSQKPK
jgi:hypothetical protein